MIVQGYFIACAVSGLHGTPAWMPLVVSVDANPQHVMSFAFETATDQDWMVVRIGKALDLRTASEFKVLCTECMDRGVRHFVLDFSQTGILDSTGLGALFSLYRRVILEDGKVVFASASPAVEAVVQLTHTDLIFPQYPSVQAARDALH